MKQKKKLHELSNQYYKYYQNSFGPRYNVEYFFFRATAPILRKTQTENWVPLKGRHIFVRKSSWTFFRAGRWSRARCHVTPASRIAFVLTLVRSLSSWLAVRRSMTDSIYNSRTVRKLVPGLFCLWSNTICSGAGATDWRNSCGGGRRLRVSLPYSKTQMLIENHSFPFKRIDAYLQTCLPIRKSGYLDPLTYSR
jgi:hypothetical protein